MARVVPDDPKEVKTKAVSDIETAWVSHWYKAISVPDYALAKAIIETGTDFEHYRALLPEDETTWTADEKADLVKYKTAFEENIPAPPIIPWGTIAFWCAENKSAFDNVSVTDLDSGAILLQTGFDDSADMVNWFPWTPGPTGYGPTSWAIQDGALRELSGSAGGNTYINWRNPIHPDTAAVSGGTYVDYVPGRNWLNYRLEADLYSYDDDPIGVMVRWYKTNTYYKLMQVGGFRNHPSVDANKFAGHWLIMATDGEYRCIQVDTMGYGWPKGAKIGRWSVEVRGNSLKWYVNDILIIDITDDGARPANAIAWSV